MNYYIGIDIQVRRNCCYALINTNGTLIDSGWLARPESESAILVGKWARSGRVYVGLDAPSMALYTPREWYWSRARDCWVRRGRQKGFGRHCEVVISAHRIAKPQWTPVIDQVPEWMKLGFGLFSVLEDLATVYEAFPSAAYTLLQEDVDVRVNADFSAFKPGPKDMLDALVAAATVREFVEGRGVEVGGGDGLGTIILPRPLPEPVIDAVMAWPG
jgi:predicted nuclease with RNAse H fold